MKRSLLVRCLFIAALTFIISCIVVQAPPPRSQPPSEPDPAGQEEPAGSSIVLLPCFHAKLQVVSWWPISFMMLILRNRFFRASRTILIGQNKGNGEQQKQGNKNLVQLHQKTTYNA